MGEDGREFRCLDAATGEVRWSFPMPDEAISFPAVADMNGDGRDECVFTMGSTIHAVGNGEVLWTLDLPGRLGPVAIAEVDDSGAAQIVVACADGHVYGIGPE
jgi:outer membrane protein assembly factor BamB